MFSWTRNYYAENYGRIYQFEAKKDRDDAVKRFGFKLITAKEAYKRYKTVHVEQRGYAVHGLFIGDKTNLLNWLNSLPIS